MRGNASAQLLIVSLPCVGSSLEYRKIEGIAMNWRPLGVLSRVT